MTNQDEPPDLQRNVQRLLGRCLLQIQQYERLLKALLAAHELAGPAETLDLQRATRIDKFSDKSLGTLVRSLFETLVVPEGFERELLPESTTPTDRISMAFSFRVSMAQEHWTQTKTAIEELVALRNDMVHHLVDHFDISTKTGCQAAAAHLEQGYERIDRHVADLAAWAKGLNAAREMNASFAQTEVFNDLVVNGIAPDGSFDWPDTGIVRTLNEATQVVAVDGWARLEDACNWMLEKYPEQTPAKYGCRTWPQVLHESRQFDLRYQPHDGRKVAWFRCRTRVHADS